MKLLKTSDVKIVDVIKILERDGIIIYPTETLYGIGVKYDNKKLLKKVFEIKNRPSEKTFPLIINLNHLDLLVSSIPPLAQKLIEKYWPGPLTLILPAKDGLPEEITSNKTVAVRMPGESFALELIKNSPFPITATSANISGYPAASDIETVLKYFEKSDITLFIDGGSLQGIPSTIVDVTITPPKIIRKGAIDIDLSFY
ncbi:MAG: L-threonylcarbamoyladenylate synthase [Thermodesulfovibrio sp.]|uniref:L-threonylcarbamoyladenylate synthase n=1 Tax=unclassified Thermodesulfovibrio TaxID=2645936 RepID=UPI00083A549E|nr:MULTISPECIES: L-threonylcarbamoyladenylate synthase [unclassified Thermodesulfovibrio]MDI1472329.1 L-threonylcarbamoyladenylate synthase [Thermodesulfovibrio sp. 1176]MDI6714194.1 L-threonylcarbamoyladenylate synthase [Thermodesulfovibrio sp.]ODA43513.1 TsaC protein (YrdC domain) required for threonylcarbamoyladenosine t(6)A37 modification in tRNA [Thermodesulfovibrio sp. N1]